MKRLTKISTLLILSAILVESINPRNKPRVKYQRSNNSSIYFHPTSLKCSFNSKYLINTKCHFKPTRDRTGQASISGEFKGVMYDLWMQEVFYYKYRVYRPWMISFDENWCDIWEGTAKPGVIMEYFLSSVTAEQREKKPCPFFGVIGYDHYNLNLDRLVSIAYPQVLPTGDYRIYVRFHKADNETYGEFFAQGHISANDVMESYYMR